MSVEQIRDRATVGLVETCASRRERVRQRLSELERQAAALEELMVLASAAAVIRRGDLSPAALLLDVSDSDRPRVAELLQTAGLEA